MSLINNMLNDLERRQANDLAGANSTLSNLHGTDTLTLETSQSRTLSFIFFTILFLLLVFILHHLYFSENILSQFLSVIESFYSSPSQVVSIIEEEHDNKKGNILRMEPFKIDSNSNRPLQKSNAKRILSLELDDQLLGEATPAFQQLDLNRVHYEREGQIIYGMEYALIDDRPNIFISTRHEPHYRIQILDSPNRLVLEFKGVEKMDEISNVFLNKPEFVTALRSKQEKDTYGYVIEFDQKLKLINTRYFHHQDKYFFRIIMDFTNQEENKFHDKEVADESLLDVFNGSVPIEENSISDITGRHSINLLNDANAPKKEKIAVVKSQTINKVIHKKDKLVASNEYYQLALSDYKEGRIDPSINKLQKALNENKNNVSARMQLAKIYLEIKQDAKAIQILMAGLEHDLSNSAMAKLCAQLLQQQGDNELAIFYLQAAKPKVMEDPEYIALLAALMQRESRYEEAINYYQKLLQWNSQQGIWWIGLAISFEGIGAQNEALQAYIKATNDVTLTTEIMNYIQKRINSLQS